MNVQVFPMLDARQTPLHLLRLRGAFLTDQEQHTIGGCTTKETLLPIPTIVLLCSLFFLHYVTTMSSASSSMFLLAGSAILVAALAAPFVFPIRKKQDDEFITADEVVKLWDQLYVEAQNIVTTMYQQLQQLIQIGAVPEAQVGNIIANSILESLPKLQTKVCNQFGVEYDCWEEATWEFVEEGDQKVQKAVERFQSLFAHFTGNREFIGKRPTKEKPTISTTDIPLNANSTERTYPTARGVMTDMDDIDTDPTPLSADEIIMAAQAFFNAATIAAKMVTDNAKANGVDLTDPVEVQGLVSELGQVTESLTEEALASFGLTSTSFQETIAAQAQNPKIGRALMIVQHQHTMALQAMGLA